MKINFSFPFSLSLSLSSILCSLQHTFTKPVFSIVLRP